MSAGWKNWRPGSQGICLVCGAAELFLDLSRVKEGYLLKKAPGTELHVGDEIVVQIQREAQKTKLPSATAELSLSGSSWRSIMEKSRKSHAWDAFCGEKNG